MSMKAHLRGESYLNKKDLEALKKASKRYCGNEVMAELGRNMDGMLMYTLSENFGFTPEQLRMFHMCFVLNTKFLGMKYQMEDCPSEVAEYLFKSAGYDLDKWYDADKELWHKLPEKNEWVQRPLEEFNEYIKTLALKVINKEKKKDDDIPNC